MAKRGLIWLIILFLLICGTVHAQEFYADTLLEVNNNGEVKISGISNHPDLAEQITQGYTSKDKQHWILNISLDQVFSDYIVEVRFPKDAVINYLKIPSILSIEEESGRPVVKGTGKNEKFYVIAQYSINGKTKSLWMYIGMPVLLAVIVLAAYLLFRMYKRRSRLGYNPEALTDRQKRIMELIVKNKGSTTQAELQKNIKIPKASLSRNVDSLVRKEIITKESKGMTNYIKIKEK